MVHIKTKQNKTNKQTKTETGQIGVVFHTIQIPLLLSLEKRYFSF